MSGVRSGIRIAQGLGVLSLLAIVAAFLALTDIGHGEPDLTLEWNVLRVAALTVIAFHVATFRALRRALRALRDS
jgi:Na+-transporting methylmalonyl-CoA/oxaloacetate decarboxylase beta subunit